MQGKARDLKAFEREAQKAAGLSPQSAFVYARQTASADHASDLFALPVDTSEWQPLGVIDPTDANYGKTYFMPGYHSPDDAANHPMR